MSIEARETNRRWFEGEVVSDRMDRTVTVLVQRKVLHALYKKYTTRKNKFMAHDANNECKVGDLVRIEECRPMSKNKHFRVTGIIKKAE